MSISSAIAKSNETFKYIFRNVTWKAARAYFRVIGSPKERMWDYEYSVGIWDRIARTPGDPIYAHVKKYANEADILDLGCGAGAMGNELSYDSYRAYTGVDISGVAIDRAISWSAQCGRSDKNAYIKGDIESYVPNKKYQVILFRESINYIALDKIVPTLLSYKNYLDKSGVFIVRIHDKEKFRAILDVLRANFTFLEEVHVANKNVVILVF